MPTFTSEVELGGKTATGTPVPDEIVEALGSGRRPAVTVTVSGHTFRSTIGTMGGVFMLPLSASNRTAAGVAAGDEVEVTVELDTAPRVVEVPPDVAAALTEHPDLQRHFENLSYSHQRRHIGAVTGAKQPETRKRRIARMIEMLTEDVASR